MSASSSEKLKLHDRSIEDLWARFSAGGSDADQAFDDLASLLGRRAYSLALRSVADPYQAEDIAQEALVRLYRYAGELQDSRAVMGWFYRITLNLINDFYRKSGRRRVALTKLEVLRQMEEQARERPLADIEREQIREAINRALQSIDEKHRDVFLLKEVEGRSHAEIARMLGIPEGTVWSRLSHARDRLRRILTGQGVMPEV
ncbi:MAG TPA: RNA polymerase sigma factor [Planctomycetota bacterium]|nr:RNA polymerase sigma factor [Planctomycetota bacterium]